MEMENYVLRVHARDKIRCQTELKISMSYHLLCVYQKYADESPKIIDIIGV